MPPRADERGGSIHFTEAMRRGLTAAGIYAVLTVVLLAPLWSQFGSAFPHDAGDPILNTWIFWHGSRTVPLTAAWWNGPMFFPAPASIALSELLLSVLPISWLVQAVTHNPVAAYNAVFALSFPLCALAAWALARELTGRDDAAMVGGLVFMFTTYRAEQYSHVQVLSYYWTPVVLLGLHRYVRTSQRRWLGLYGGAWLLQSLVNGYAMFHVTLLVGLWTLWFARSWAVALRIALTGAVAALPMVPLLLAYNRVHGALHLTRDINEVKAFGVDLADFVTAAPDLAVWGGRLGVARPETAAFPGLTLVLLAVAALLLTRGTSAATAHPSSEAGTVDESPAGQTTWQRVCVWLSMVAALVAFSAYAFGPWKLGPLSVKEFHKPFTIAVYLRAAAFLGGPWVRRHWRARSVVGFYVLAMAAMYVLALGPEPRLLGRPLLYESPYSWFMRLPGFEVLRVPARFVMLAAVCQVVLVAAAVARWAVGSRRVLIASLIALGLIVDGWMWLPVEAAPRGGITRWPEVAAVLELPLSDPATDFGAMFRAMSHGRPTVNGVSGYLPPHYLPLAQALKAGQYDALFELTHDGTLGVAVDRSQPHADAVERGLQGIGARPLEDGAGDSRWAGYLLPPRPADTEPPVPAAVPVQSVRASHHPEDVRRMLDGDVATAWGSGVPQIGGEEVVLDLGQPRDVSTLVLQMGSYAFGHANALEVSVSVDDATWTRVFEGPLGVRAVRAAVQRPETVPISIPLTPSSARFVRLRQTGAEPGIPWWIGEIGLR